jgi:hypothetical protein
MDVFSGGRVALWLLALDGEMWPINCNYRSDAGQEEFLHSVKEFPLDHLENANHHMVKLIQQTIKKNPDVRVKMEGLQVLTSILD